MNKRQLVVAFLFSLFNIVHWCWWDAARLVHFDEEKCSRAIISSTHKIAAEFLSIDQKERVINIAAKVAMDPELSGDYVEVDVSLPSSCNEIGSVGLIFSIAQRTAMSDPFCNLQRLAPKRAVWLAFRDGTCIEGVKKLFHDHKFSVIDTNSSIASNGVGVPIHLLVGSLLPTLSDSQVENIALLRIGRHILPKIVENAPASKIVERGVQSPGDDQLTTNTLHALISLYRKVGIGGFVVLDGVWLDEAREFLIDGNHTQLHISINSTAFIKKDTQIRIPKNYRTAQINTVIDPNVIKAWGTLGEWHKETVKQFVGHVGTNPYQSYRYAESMRNIIDFQKKRSGVGNNVTINVCETGFNGGENFV